MFTRRRPYSWTSFVFRCSHPLLAYERRITVQHAHGTESYQGRREQRWRIFSISCRRTPGGRFEIGVTLLLAHSLVDLQKMRITSRLRKLTRMKESCVGGFLLISSRHAADHPRGKYGLHPCQLIAVRIPHGELFPRKDAEELGEFDVDPRLLPHFPHCRIRRQLMRIDDPTWCPHMPDGLSFTSNNRPWSS